MKVTKKNGIVKKVVFKDKDTTLALYNKGKDKTLFEEYGRRTTARRFYTTLMGKPVFSYLSQNAWLFAAILFFASFTILPFALLVIAAVGWGVIQAFLVEPIASAILFVPPAIGVILFHRYAMGKDEKYQITQGMGDLNNLINLPESLLWDMSEDLQELVGLNRHISEGVSVMQELPEGNTLRQSVYNHTQLLVSDRNALWARLHSYTNMTEDFTETTALPVVKNTYDESAEARAFAFMSR